MRNLRFNIIVTTLTLTIFCSLFSVVLPAYAESMEEEVKIGKEAADQIAKEYKFIDDKDLVERVETIGKAIADVAREKETRASYGSSTLMKFDYKFKIVDDKDVNAFALPGGFIYVNKGLLDSVQSDDELAGVLAHEIAHVSHHHAMQMIKSQQKQMLATAAAVIAGAALGAKGSDLGSLAYIANLINMAKLSDYGQQAEYDADRTAVSLLVHTKYNPVGMLTFMEKLVRQEMLKPKVIYGIFATHPDSYLRAAEIIDELNSHGVTVNRRLVTDYTRVKVKPVEGSDAYSIWISGTEIIRLANSGGERAQSRADRVAGKLSNLLLSGAGIHDVKVGGGGIYVVIIDDIVIYPTSEDCELAGKGISDLTKSAADAIQLALMKERLGQRG